MRLFYAAKIAAELNMNESVFFFNKTSKEQMLLVTNPYAIYFYVAKLAFHFEVEATQTSCSKHSQTSVLRFTPPPYEQTRV